MIHLEITECGLGLRALLAARNRPFSLEVASLEPTYKFSEAPEALRARFFAGLGRFGAPTCSPEAPQDAPGPIFEPETTVFSRCLRATSVRRAKRPTSIKRWQEQYETHFEAAARRPKTFEHRTAGASNCVWRCQRRFRASWEWSRRLLERLWGAPGTLMDASWSLLARPGRPLIGLGAALWRPKTVPSASGRVPEMALGAQTGP